MIDEAQLIEAIRYVAATEPDRIYAVADPHGHSLACNYRPNQNNPCGCIVGEALAFLGVPAELLAELDLLQQRTVPAAWRAPALASVLDDRLTTAALKSGWVALVQAGQDTGLRWADAVRAADDRYPEHAGMPG